MNKKVIMAVLIGGASIFVGNLAFEWYQKSKVTGA